MAFRERMNSLPLVAGTVSWRSCPIQIGCSTPSNSLLCSPAQPIKVSCAGLLWGAWYGNTALPQCTLCVNRLRANYYVDVYSLCKRTVITVTVIILEFSHVQKWRYGIRHRMMEKNGRSPVRTPAVVRNNDWCFQVRVYNGCCAGLHNKKFDGTEHSSCIVKHLRFGSKWSKWSVNDSYQIFSLFWMSAFSLQEKKLGWRVGGGLQMDERGKKLHSF
jgi:hypothetical protein